MRCFVKIIMVGLIVFSFKSKGAEGKPSLLINDLERITCEESYDVGMDYLIAALGTESHLHQMEFDDFKLGLKFKDLEAQNLFYTLYSDFYKALLKLSLEEDNENILELATQIKVEDASSEFRKRMISEIQEKIKIISSKLKSKGMECPPAATSKVTEKNTAIKIQGLKKQNPVKSFIKRIMEKVLAVTYQSCDVLKLKPLTANVPNVEGIQEKCCHGKGMMRTISNLSSLLKTNYYLQSPLTGPQCFSIKENPLIYDYGGRPNFTRGLEGKLDFFSNLGGTNVLGYDCSALVYSVLLGGGLRLKSNKPFVASDVIAAQSKQFISPEVSGWDCLKRITLKPNQSIEVGDIVSFNGHVVMIYSTGEDPFGIRNLKSCHDVKIQSFDFNVFQSSPSKEGIGINVYEAKDYLEESEQMAEIFLDYARSACLSQKQNKNIFLKRKAYSIIRHTQSPECQTKPVSFENESCVVGTCI